MTTINFPDTPTVGQIHAVDSKSWVWTGVAWDAVKYSLPPGELIVVSSTAPENPQGSSFWFNPVSKDLFVWDVDGWSSVSLKAVSSDGTPVPSKIFVGQDAPSELVVSDGDLWNDIDDDSGETEFIFTGPEQPENFGVDTLWIDTDEPELPLIYADNEPPEYTNVEGDFWVDLDDTFGSQFVQSLEEPLPTEAEFWVDLASEAEGLSYADLFKNGGAFYDSVQDLPAPAVYIGMISYVIDSKSIYLATETEWVKIYPNSEGEALVWMGL